MSGEAAEYVDVDRLPFGLLALYPLCLDGQAGGAAAELRLRLGEVVSASEVGEMGFVDVPVAARPSALPVAVDEQGPTVADGGTCMGRAWGRDGTKGHRSTMVRGPEPRDPGSSDAERTTIG